MFFLGGVGSGRGGRVGGGGSGWMGTENWSFCENSKKKKFFLGGGRVGGEGASGGGGVRVDVNGEVKFLWEFKKKIWGGGGQGRVGVGGVRSGVGVGEVG